jgi:hypothetical protein
VFDIAKPADRGRKLIEVSLLLMNPALSGFTDGFLKIPKNHYAILRATNHKEGGCLTESALCL